MRMLTPGGESQWEGWSALTEDENLQVQPPFPHNCPSLDSFRIPASGMPTEMDGRRAGNSNRGMPGQSGTKRFPRIIQDRMG